MNLLAKAVAFTVLTAPALAYVPQRRLQDSITEGLCTACDTCDALGDLCNVNDLVSLACGSCGSFGVDGLCDACTTCDSAGDLCDPQSITNLGCGLCDVDLPTDDPSACFSEVATVEVLGTEGTTTTTTMKDLKLGDRVLTQDGSYETVYAFGHHDPQLHTKFLQIHSDKVDRPLEVTADHLIFLQDKAAPVPAATINIGDAIRGVTAGSIVTKVDLVERKGIFAPLTTGGTLVVDGVAASSYIHFDDKQQLFSDHELIHVALSPYRMLCEGVSSSFCDPRLYLDNGMPHYAHYGLKFLSWLFDSNFIIQTVGLSIVFAVTGGSYILENMFGSSMAPLMMLVSATAYYHASQAKKTSIKAKSI